MSKKTAQLLEIAIATNNWESFLATRSPQHQSILRAVGAKTVTAAIVARQLFAPETSISSAMSKLAKEGILKAVSRGNYRVVDEGFASYLEALDLPPASKEDAAIEAENVVYRAIFPLFESLQHQGLLKEDSHHMAKAVAVTAKQMICRCWKLDGNQKTDTIS